MNEHDDLDLRVAFKALGGQLRQSVPAFHQMTSREALSAVRWRRRRRLAALSLVVTAIPALLTIGGRTDRALDYERFTALTGLDLSEVTWEAPSDFLLEFPGRDLLRGVPLIGVRAPVIAPDTARPSDSNVTKGRSRS